MQRLAELRVRLALIGCLGLFLVGVAIQSFANSAGNRPGVILGIAVVLWGLTMAIVWILARRIRQLETTQRDLARRLNHTEWERDAFQAAIEACPDALEIVDRDLRPLVANRHFADWFQECITTARELSTEATSHCRAARLVNGEAFDRWLVQLRENPEQVDYRRVDFLDGPVNEAECFTAPVRATDGAVIGRLFCYHDVSREIESLRATSQLVASFGHDLRTPLASVIGLAELLSLRDYPDAERQKFLRMLVDESHRLASLVDALLDVLRVQSRASEGNHGASHPSEAKAVGQRR